MKPRPKRWTPQRPGHPRRARAKYLLYLGLLVLVGGAIFVRARLGGPPPCLAGLSLPELEARAGRDPRNPWYQLELGIRNVKAGRPSAAEEAFQRCLALAPNTMEAHAYLGTMALQRHENPRA